MAAVSTSKSSLSTVVHLWVSEKNRSQSAWALAKLRLRYSSTYHSTVKTTHTASDNGKLSACKASGLAHTAFQNVIFSPEKVFCKKV